MPKVDELKEKITSLDDLVNKLIGNQVEVQKVIKKLEDKSSDIYVALSDMVRPGNPERKQKAITSLKYLGELLQEGIKLGSKLKSDYSQMSILNQLIEEWSQYILDLIPLIQVSLVIPEAEVKVNWEVLISFAQLGVGVVNYLQGLSPISTAFLMLTMELIKLILIAEERKQLFEDIEKQATQESKKLKEQVIDKLKIEEENILTFIESIAKNLEVQYVRDNFEFGQVIEDIRVQVRILRDWNVKYTILFNNIKKYEIFNDKALSKLKIVVDTLIPDDTESNNNTRLNNEIHFNLFDTLAKKDVENLLILACALEKKWDIVEVSEKLELNDEQAKRLKIQARLLKFDDPREIAKDIDKLSKDVKIKEEKVRKIGDQLNKLLNLQNSLQQAK